MHSYLVRSVGGIHSRKNEKLSTALLYNGVCVRVCAQGFGPIALNSADRAFASSHAMQKNMGQGNENTLIVTIGEHCLYFDK